MTNFVYPFSDRIRLTIQLKSCFFTNFSLTTNTPFRTVDVSVTLVVVFGRNLAARPVRVYVAHEAADEFALFYFFFSKSVPVPFCLGSIRELPSSEWIQGVIWTLTMKILLMYQFFLKYIYSFFFITLV